MNDVKITEGRQWTKAKVRADDYIVYIRADVVAALRAHFAAEQPATPTPSTEQIVSGEWANRIRAEVIEQAAKVAEGGHDPLAHCCRDCSVYSERWHIATAIRALATGGAS